MTLRLREVRSLAPGRTVLSCRQRTGAQVGWLSALCPVHPLDEHTLPMDVRKQVEETPRKAPRWWEVGGRAKFGTRVLAVGEAGPCRGNGRLPAARGSCMSEGQRAWGNTMGGIQPDLGLQNSPQASVWFQSPEISPSSAWPVPGSGVNLCPRLLCGRAGRDRVSCLLQGGP